MSTITSKDTQVLLYQQTGISEPLVKEYENFLNKYYTLLTKDAINFRNYDIRCFLSCFINNKGVVKNLKKGKFHSQESIKQAYKALNYLKWIFRNHTKDELKSELLIPFLLCARHYKQQGSSFKKYIYVSYKFMLKRYIDSMNQDLLDHSDMLYKSNHTDEYDADTVEEALDKLESKNLSILEIEMPTGLELSHPKWIHGDSSQFPFSDLKSHERYILAKYYYEGYTDKEIARMLPYHSKSIHRIRKRIQLQLQNMFNKGELKCLRMPNRIH
ncbi:MULTISPECIES: sigma-70 family RNA polymerase sigma factor [Bacillus cereus group]|uniref:sigma-70 family RNA polymerase sigma factor n=1 Tax=Bacillus cereus group TaxID=86661 RepID=UPI0021CE91CB|nr:MULTISPECIES: sigma-70 family RNA polymerase sigma factor [Bacillus cereus group]MCU5224113.1 sigma-70 family RNA polymerase sigma factor [Bacillus tropicus]MCU5501874.1 sigma-70 family RNA polymerase sigma factor [Bacillus cereus]MDR5046783.1 sigma-70 family RNA polymerase sigma factor [Bacillus thuringiensis]